MVPNYEELDTLSHITLHNLGKAPPTMIPHLSSSSVVKKPTQGQVTYTLMMRDRTILQFKITVGKIIMYNTYQGMKTAMDIARPTGLNIQQLLMFFCIL